MNIQWAFNSATVMHCGWEEELRLWQQFGWRAAEIWFSKIEARLAQGATYEQLAQQMRDAGVQPVGLWRRRRVVLLPGEPFVEYQLFAQQNCAAEILRSEFCGVCRAGFRGHLAAGDEGFGLPMIIWRLCKSTFTPGIPLHPAW